MLPAPLLTLHEEVFRIPDGLFVPPEELGCCSIVQEEPGLSSDAVEVLQALWSVLVLPLYPFQLPLELLLAAEQVVARNATVLEDDLGRLRRPDAQLRLLLPEPQAWIVLRHHERGLPAMA